VLATGLGAELDRVEVEREHALASATYEIRTGVVPEGTIAGWRFRYLGIVDARVLAVIDTSWRTHDELGTAPGWPTGEAWDVTIVAEPEVRVHWEVGPAAGSASRSVDRMTAAASHLVNSVSAVRRAPSGIMTLGDLANAVGRWAIPPRPRPPGERHP
jgi:4-hydroxy-tetrahydrodipicolinate reductase